MSVGCDSIVTAVLSSDEQSLSRPKFLERVCQTMYNGAARSINMGDDPVRHRSYLKRMAERLRGRQRFKLTSVPNIIHINRKVLLNVPHPRISMHSWPFSYADRDLLVEVYTTARTIPVQVHLHFDAFDLSSEGETSKHVTVELRNALNDCSFKFSRKYDSL